MGPSHSISGRGGEEGKRRRGEEEDIDEIREGKRDIYMNNMIDREI